MPVLLCVNSEWQACGSSEVETGSRRLARELFGDSPVLDMGSAQSGDLSPRDGVFALDCVQARFRTTLAAIEAAAPERIFTVGGTCASEAAPVAYLSARYAQLGVVWFDAHGDLNTPSSSPSGHFHGMVLRTLLGDGPPELTSHIPVALAASRVAIAGVRDLDAPERAFIESGGVGIVEGWPDDVATRVIAHLRAGGATHLYVHVDVDVFDPSAFGDALFSVPGGPRLDSASPVVRQVAKAFDIVGVGVVESCGCVPGAATRLVEFLIDSELWPAD
ncbi:MAG: arginase family protein [Coriobacteriia bacterium]|nr:arginase family protein [Coriobacteriia bacterium]